MVCTLGVTITHLDSHIFAGLVTTSQGLCEIKLMLGYAGYLFNTSKTGILRIEEYSQNPSVIGIGQLWDQPLPETKTYSALLELGKMCNILFLMGTNKTQLDNEILLPKYP